MEQLELIAIPNQSFSIMLDENFYDITLLDTNGCMSVSVAINNEVILTNSRIVAGIPLIPYEYMENGNFAIVTADDDLPDYTKFEITQFLIYASQEELEEIRGTTT